MKKTLAATAVVFLAAMSPLFGQWQDDFDSLDPGRWVVSNYSAPGSNPAYNHQGYFVPEHVTTTGGYLVLKLVQQQNGSTYTSFGGEIRSKSRYGYGTYEWRARMASTATTPVGSGSSISGGISALFSYYERGSYSEIDFELEGSMPGFLHTTSWTSLSNSETNLTAIDGMTSGFKTYKYVWMKDRIEFYVDNLRVATHTRAVPRRSALFMINHWGTNNSNFGGLATPGPVRYLYVDWVRYTPLPRR